MHPLLGSILHCNQLHGIIYIVLYTAVYDTFFHLRQNYYHFKQQIDDGNDSYLNLILNKNLHTLKQFHCNDYEHGFIPPSNCSTIKNADYLEYVLRILWLTIIMKSTHENYRQSLNYSGCFTYPYRTLLDTVLESQMDDTFMNHIQDNVYKSGIYPPHFPCILDECLIDNYSKLKNNKSKISLDRTRNRKSKKFEFKFKFNQSRYKTDIHSKTFQFNSRLVFVLFFVFIFVFYVLDVQIGCMPVLISMILQSLFIHQMT